MIINNAAVNISCRISVFMFFSSDNPRGLAGSYGGSIFNFLRKLHMFSTVAAPIYIPTTSSQAFLFLHILVNTCHFLSFDDSHSNRCEVISHCAFDVHFPDD